MQKLGYNNIDNNVRYWKRNNWLYSDNTQYFEDVVLTFNLVQYKTARMRVDSFAISIDQPYILELFNSVFYSLTYMKKFTWCIKKSMSVFLRYIFFQVTWVWTSCLLERWPSIWRLSCVECAVLYSPNAFNKTWYEVFYSKIAVI